MIHYSAPTLIQMRLPSGRLAENNEENVRVFANHFKKVLNNHKPTDREVVKNIDLREVMRELDVPLSWAEFICVIRELTNNKAPGINGIPPNAFKSINKENLQHHFDFITEFWEDRVDFVKWHEGQVVPVPKRGDHSN